MFLGFSHTAAQIDRAYDFSLVDQLQEDKAMNPDDWASRVKGVFKAELKSWNDPATRTWPTSCGPSASRRTKKISPRRFRAVNSKLCFFISVS